MGHALAFGALALVAVVLIFSFIPTLFGYEHFIVVGGSMGRAMPVGSLAITRLVDVRTITVGDIVSYRTKNGARITHRVLDFGERDGHRVFHTKGDTNATPDPEPLILNGEVAKVDWVLPYVGFAIGWARSPAGVLLLVLVPLAGLAFDRPRVKKVRRPSTVTVAAPPPSDCACVPQHLVVAATALPVKAGLIRRAPATKPARKRAPVRSGSKPAVAR
jgi:signal peptidase